MFEDQRNCVCGKKGIVEAEHDEYAEGGLGVRSRVAERTLTQVPSEPTSARAN